MITVEGLHGISAKVLLNSLSRDGVRLITFELTYPRIIHSEFMTHRMLSKNAASSRAIPFNKMKEQLTGRPVRFGQANPGMQDRGSDFDTIVYGDTYDTSSVLDYTEELSPAEAWERAKEDALRWSEAMYDAGLAKQVYNRATEPFQQMKVVCSGTEFPNFYWLRDDGAADPTIAELARVMKQAQYESAGMVLYPGEYHLPYVGRYRDEDGVLHYGDDIVCEGHVVDGTEYSLEDAIKVSAARCAAVSFRNIDYDLKKCLEVHERLVGDERKHSSAMEHQCEPMPEGVSFDTPGVTALHKKMGWMSGNMRGWVQYRQLIEGHTVYDY